MKEYLIPKTGYVMRYHDFPGDDMPILFIHGLGCAGSFDYPGVASQAPLKNHRRILVDLLGAGYNGIQIEIVKNAGHAMTWENPEGLALVISKAIQHARTIADRKPQR